VPRRWVGHGHGVVRAVRAEAEAAGHVGERRARHAVQEAGRALREERLLVCLPVRSQRRETLAGLVELLRQFLKALRNGPLTEAAALQVAAGGRPLRGAGRGARRATRAGDYRSQVDT
jgi:hypothetical protein